MKLRGDCSVCGREYALRPDGTVRGHGRTRGNCPGSLRSPHPGSSREVVRERKRDKGMPHIEDGHLPALCWCAEAIVSVPQPEVRDGLTRPCRRDRCVTLDRLRRSGSAGLASSGPPPRSGGVNPGLAGAEGNQSTRRAGPAEAAPRPST